MRKLLILALLCFPVPLFGQTTAVTATITDSDSIAWANGTFTVTFVPNPSFSQYQYQGAAFVPQVYTGTMNGSGVMSITTPDNTFISPSGTQWLFTLCPNASAKCTPVTTQVTGASQSFTSLFSSKAIPPRFAATGPGSYGYSIVEINQTPVPGGTFYNVTLGCTETWSGSAFACPTAGTVTSFSSGNLSPLFTTSVATPTTTPALSFAQISQAQNLVFASPSGSSGVPTFRALVNADLPGGGGVNSVSGTANQIASTGGANPVLSLTAPVLTPGSLFVPQSFQIGWSGVARFGVTSSTDINCLDGAASTCFFTLGPHTSSFAAIKSNGPNLQVELADGSNTKTGLIAANLTDNALTSGRCVQAGAAGLLGNAAGACANGTGFTQLSTGTFGGTSCTTGSSTYNTCTSTVTISPTMPDTSYYCFANGISPSDPRALTVNCVAASTSTVTVTVITEGSVAVNFGNLQVFAIHP